MTTERTGTWLESRWAEGAVTAWATDEARTRLFENASEMRVLLGQMLGAFREGQMHSGHADPCLGCFYEGTIAALLEKASPGDCGDLQCPVCHDGDATDCALEGG